MLEISYKPYSLEFTKSKNGKFEEMKVSFTNIGQKELRLRVVDYPKGYFEVQLNKENLMPGKMVELKVNPAKTLPGGIVKKSITLQVNAGKGYRITIPVKI